MGPTISRLIPIIARWMSTGLKVIIPVRPSGPRSNERGVDSCNRSPHKFVEILHTDCRRCGEGDSQQVAQGGRSLHRVLCVRHIDDEHQVDVPEQGVAALELSAVLFDQAMLSWVRSALMAFTASIEYLPNMR